MFILGTICCRGGSKGVRSKNIKPLYGKPLINYTIDTATQCTLINDVIVSTDNSEIATVAKNAGIQFIIDRPAELATDAASKWPVFIHALETYEKAKEMTVDYIVDMDVTVPAQNKRRY